MFGPTNLNKLPAKIIVYCKSFYIGSIHNVNHQLAIIAILFCFSYFIIICPCPTYGVNPQSHVYNHYANWNISILRLNATNMAYCNWVLYIFVYENGLTLWMLNNRNMFGINTFNLLGYWQIANSFELRIIQVLYLKRYIGVRLKGSYQLRRLS